MSAQENSRRTALVTGAGQGIGQAIALQLAADGFNVAVNDIPSNIEKVTAVSNDIKAKGRASSVHITDVSVEEQVKLMIDDVVKEHGSLDVMIANAGITLYGSVMDTPLADWDRLYGINVRGTFLCYKYAAKQMVAQGRGGRLIGACSVAGKRGVAHASAYVSSKFAIRGLTQSAATELGAHGITVNTYAPGAVDTPMMNFLDEVSVKHDGRNPGDYQKFATSLTPLGRLGTSQDIADVVSFLVSDKGKFITGQSISCDGGMYFD